MLITGISHLLRSVQARFVKVIFEGRMIYRNGGDPLINIGM